MDPVTVEREVPLDVPAVEAADLALTQEGLSAWLGDDVDFQPAEGSSGTVTDDGTTWQVLVEHVDAQRSLSFTWWPVEEPERTSRVTISVRPDGGGSVVRITETCVLSADSGERWTVRGMLLWARARCAALV